MPAGELHDGLAIGGLALITTGLLALVGCGGDTRWVRAIPDAPTPAEADAAAVVRLLPLAACVVVFWAVYSQMVCHTADRIAAALEPTATSCTSGRIATSTDPSGRR